MKLVYQFTAIFFAFSPTLNHLHSLQGENCDSNLRLVVDEDDNGKLRIERVKSSYLNFHPIEVTAIHHFKSMQIAYYNCLI